MWLFDGPITLTTIASKSGKNSDDLAGPIGAMEPVQAGSTRRKSRRSGCYNEPVPQSGERRFELSFAHCAVKAELGDSQRRGVIGARRVVSPAVAPFCRTGSGSPRHRL
jgi:hypothetical protein